jgi:hypothetical protein
LLGYLENSKKIPGEIKSTGSILDKKLGKTGKNLVRVNPSI